MTTGLTVDDIKLVRKPFKYLVRSLGLANGLPWQNQSVSHEEHGAPEKAFGRRP
jgi:hypothetical protein